MSAIVFLLIFQAVTTFSALLLSLVFGSLTMQAAVLSPLAGLAAAFLAARETRGMGREEKRPGWLEYAMFFFFVLFCLRHFLWIYFYKNGEICTFNWRHNYSDLALHLSYIANFVNGTGFWPENPIFTGEPLNYHIGLDLFTAIWAKLGISLYRVMPIVGLCGGLLTMFALYYWGRGFAMASLLFSGGVAGYLVFSTGAFDDYQADLAWKSIPLTLLVPQRGFLFAFPAGLILLWSWRRRFVSGKQPLSFWIEGLLWGIMPLFQLNAFLFLSMVFLIWSVCSGKIRQALPVYYTAVLPATFLVLKLTKNFNLSSSFFWLSPGWMSANENPFFFFFINFGFFPLLTACALFFAIRRRHKEDLMVIVPAVLLGVLFLTVMVMPHAWDNIKYIVWCYLLAVPVIDSQIISRFKWHVRIGLYFLLFLSGFVSVVGSMKAEIRGVPIIRTEEKDLVCGMLETVPPMSRVATAQDFAHPVLLCGRMVVAGWNGHLWSHGLNPASVEQQLSRLMQGEWDWKHLAGNLGAKYLFWGAREQKAYPESNRPWEVESLKAAETKWGTLYDLTASSGLSPGAGLSPEPTDGAAGLLVSYYGNASWEGAVLEEAMKIPAFNWEQPAHRERSAPFSAVYEGEILFPEDGVYKLYIASDDGSRLSVNGEVVIDNTGIHAVRTRSAEKYFSKGFQAVRLEYSDVGGGAYLNIWWKTPSGGKEERIPPGHFKLPKGKKAP